MLKSLFRLFGVRTARTANTGYDPIYGLSQRALDDWLSLNPQRCKEYESVLKARTLPAREFGTTEHETSVVSAVARPDSDHDLVQFQKLQSRHAMAPSRSDDDRVDVSSEDSFPASDAPSWTGVMGTGSPPTHADQDYSERHV
jgi:hypothetical protein